MYLYIYIWFTLLPLHTLCTILDVHILNGTEKPRQAAAPHRSSCVSLKALRKEVQGHRMAMEAVVAKGFGKESTRTEFEEVARKIGAFNDTTMMELDNEYTSNPHCINALFTELLKLLNAHFKAECHFSNDEVEQRKLVPAYTVSHYVFTVADMEKMASRGV